VSVVQLPAPRVIGPNVAFMSASTPRSLDPLSDALFRPTSDGAASSAVRLRAQEISQHSGVPSRAGNAMARSRAAILSGAGRAVELSGTRMSMAQVAAAAGVAKATLYNHFRTREDVLNSLLVAEIDRLIGQLGHLELSEALLQAAVAISEHPLLEALGGEDTDTLAVLARVDVRSTGWMRVAEATEVLLARHGRRGAPTVLRWLSSFVIAPAEVCDIRADVAVLVAGLPPLRPEVGDAAFDGNVLGPASTG
jgi:AcrR family transcriptional regulator